MQSKRFLIDIDGVITKEKRLKRFDYKYIYSLIPISDVIRKIRKLYKEGNLIFLYTSREEYLRKPTEDWLKKIKVPYHKLIMEKPNGEYYVDDKNLSVESFLKLNSQENKNTCKEKEKCDKT